MLAVDFGCDILEITESMKFNSEELYLNVDLWSKN